MHWKFKIKKYLPIHVSHNLSLWTIDQHVTFDNGPIFVDKLPFCTCTLESIVDLTKSDCDLWLVGPRFNRGGPIIFCVLLRSVFVVSELSENVFDSDRLFAGGKGTVVAALLHFVKRESRCLKSI